MAHTIETRIVLGATCTPETAERIRAMSGAAADTECGFSVFQTIVDSMKKVYCCWAGGMIDDDGKPHFSMVGLGALEALVDLHKQEFGIDGCLIIRQVKLGPTPIRDKVIRAILNAPDNSCICFLGDLAGELDGKMSKAFNLGGEPIFMAGSNIAKALA